MKKLFVTLIGVLIGFAALAEGEYRLMVLGEGDIKSMTTELSNAVCRSKGIDNPSDVLPISGGYECKAGGKCSYGSKFDLTLKINNKSYIIKNINGGSERFSGVILNSQCKEAAMGRYTEVSSTFLNSFYEINKGHTSFEAKNLNGVIVEICKKLEVELTVDSATNEIVNRRYRDVLVRCP